MCSWANPFPPDLGSPEASSMLTFSPTVSEGRRDQCEAPSDPKFPDCSGKVEVRLGLRMG